MQLKSQNKLLPVKVEFLVNYYCTKSYKVQVNNITKYTTVLNKMQK